MYLRERIILRISRSSKLMDDKLTLETEFDELDKALSLEIGVHWDAKKSLK